MPSAQSAQTCPPTWCEELTHELADATEKTRAAWLSPRNVTATYLKAVMPHLEAAFHRGRLGCLRDQGMLPPSLTHPLTGREKQVIVRAARGMSNAKIGADLCLSEDTIKTHLQRIYKKTGTHDRAHAVTLLLIRGDITAADVLEPPDDNPGTGPQS
ncbi:response regulator transcription factor [Streptomyces sp. NBC_01304]|uniref:response regulator transcription factor n=1 Tax=Streptomyces sp. NBC_01304 TaxID=2903818 RepID=UPI002E149071|nr:helix-turn-helix transcriptional regulator [Streptomyces sp. NBC_01304]